MMAAIMPPTRPKLPLSGSVLCVGTGTGITTAVREAAVG